MDMCQCPNTLISLSRREKDYYGYYSQIQDCQTVDQALKFKNISRDEKTGVARLFKSTRDADYESDESDYDWV